METIPFLNNMSFMFSETRDTVQSEAEGYVITPHAFKLPTIPIEDKFVAGYLMLLMLEYKVESIDSLLEFSGQNSVMGGFMYINESFNVYAHHNDDLKYIKNMNIHERIVLLSDDDIEAIMKGFEDLVCEIDSSVLELDYIYSGFKCTDLSKIDNSRITILEKIHDSAY